MLSEEFPLDANLVSLFQRDGHVLLRGLATPELVAEFRPLILAARNRHGQERTPLEKRDTYGKAFLKGMNLWVADEDVCRFVLAPRFAQVAAKLLGVRGVRLYHTRLCSKNPAGALPHGIKTSTTGRLTPGIRSPCGCPW